MEGVVRVEGARLPYRSEGSGPPMLVLGSPTFYARALPAALREDLELIFVELRHFVPDRGWLRAPLPPRA